jgi:aryl sulfotransferase
MTLTDTHTSWPRKTRDIHSHREFDSTVWDDFAFRDDDVVVASYPKAGTTWTQQIVTQLLHDGAEGIDLSTLCQWVDFRFPEKEEKLAMFEAQAHRRCLKTHLPIDALVYSPKAKYIYVARDGRDVVWSLHNQNLSITDFMYRRFNELPARFGPPLERPQGSIRDFFMTWLKEDGRPNLPWWSHVRSWWENRTLPNLLLVHYANLKADMPGEIRRIANFLETPVDEERWPIILEHCSFEYMKANGNEVFSLAQDVFDGGAGSFFNKGTNGRWRDVLTADESALYDQIARRELGEECANWLATGK